MLGKKQFNYVIKNVGNKDDYKKNKMERMSNHKENLDINFIEDFSVVGFFQRGSLTYLQPLRGDYTKTKLNCGVM